MTGRFGVLAVRMCTVLREGSMETFGDEQIRAGMILEHVLRSETHDVERVEALVERFERLVHLSTEAIEALSARLAELGPT
jgi:hypothetical protein